MELATEVECETNHDSEVGSGTPLTFSISVVTHNSIPDIGNDADLVAYPERSHETDTTSDIRLVDMYITYMNVGNDVLVRTEESVSVNIVEVLLSEISVLLANGKTLPTDTDSTPVIEPLSTVNINSETCSAMRM
jgi:hypothetical protein